MKCKYCASENVVKNGQQTNGRKKYHCKNCKRYFQENYAYLSYTTDDNQIILLTKEGCGVRSTSRILNISPTTVIRRVMKIANRLKRPYPILKGKTYEVDELFTYVGNKDNRICVAYSYESKTGKVLDISVGRRNKTNLKKVTETLVLSEAKTIYTDGLDLYEKLIPKSIHRIHQRCTNHIERQNLTLRTHLKRLNRKTICYSKSVIMLLAVVKIYFWG
jgi:insertion element IS1 protein InsB